MTRRAVFHDTGDDSYDDGAGALTDFPSTSGGPPSGAAGGDLTGTYPNPTLGTGAFGTPAVALGTAAAAGASSDAVRTDATIVAFDATVPSTQAFGDAAAAGSAAVAARRDHKHAMPATPTSVSGNAGTATALATSRNIDGQAFNGTADITVIAPGTHAATSKVTPVDADELALVDSAASNVLKRLLWSNLKATLKTYFDTLYASSSGSAPIGTSELIYRYVVTGSDKASIDTGVDTPAAGSNDWTAGDVLEVFFIGRTDTAVQEENIDVTVNNDGNAKYDFQYTLGISTGVSAATSLAQVKWVFAVLGSSATAGYAGHHHITFPGYAATTFNKEGLLHLGYSHGTAGNNRVGPYALGFRDTSALTRIKFAAQGAAKFKVGSQLLVYKRRSA